jgi:hypothetical protein
MGVGAASFDSEHAFDSPPARATPTDADLTDLNTADILVQMLIAWPVEFVFGLADANEKPALPSELTV